MARSNQTALFRLGALTLGILFASGVAHSVAQTNAPQQLPPKIEPKAVNILRAACDTLSRAQTMGFTAVDTYESKGA
jgi:hypothetical protein